MATLPLSQTVDASARKRSWRSSAISLLTSTLVQGSAIATLIVAPLLAMQAPPLPQNAATFRDFVPIVPAPPPPPKTVEHNRRLPVAPARLASEGLRHPVEIPDGIPDEEARVDGDMAGVFDGVPGGLPGAPTAQPIVTTPDPSEERPTAPMEIGGNIRPPRKIRHVNPVYPKIAILSRIEGEVAVRAIIDATGTVVDLSVVRSDSPLLEKAALNAVKQWRYEPTLQNGRPVAIIMTVTVTFRLRA